MALIVGSYTKAPSDTLKATVNFGPDLPTSVTLSSAAAAVVSGGGGLSVGAVPTNDTTTATLTITGGKRAETYIIEVTGTYSDGEVRTFGVEIVVV